MTYNIQLYHKGWWSAKSGRKCNCSLMGSTISVKRDMISQIFSYFESYNLPLFSSSTSVLLLCMGQSTAIAVILHLGCCSHRFNGFLWTNYCIICWQPNVLWNSWEISEMLVFLEFEDTFGYFFGICYILDLQSQECFIMAFPYQDKQSGKSCTQVKNNCSSSS